MRKHKVKLLSITDAIPIIGSRSNPADTVFIKQTNSYNIIDIYVTDSTGLCVGGKTQNLGNTDLTLTTARTLDTNNLPFFITKKPNKSIDATFNRMLVEDGNGQQAFVDNPFQAWKSALNIMSPAETLELSQLFNGGSGSVGAMSVNLISPPIVQNQYDTVEYILLRGINLNLNVLSSSIEILASDKTTVVATIPNNQIQVNANGLELIFSFNFYNFNEGQYFIKITSGVKTYITSLDLTIVQSITNIDLDNVTWDIDYASDVTPNPADSASGRNVFIENPLLEAASSQVKVSVKSSELFAQGDDFSLEFSLNLGYKYSIQDLSISSFGVGYSNTDNNLFKNSLIDIGYSYSGNHGIFLYNNYNYIGGENYTPLNINVTIIKTGNVFKTSFLGTNNVTTLSNNSGYSFFCSIVGRGVSISNTIQIIKAFKLN